MELDQLTLYELENLIKKAEKILKTKQQSTSTHHSLIEREEMSKVCPHCKSAKIIRYGHHNWTQRFLCKECKRTFGSTQFTLFYHSRVSYEKWMKFIQCELLHLTLKQTSEICELSMKACFNMRDKLYKAVNKREEAKQLSGTTEVDALYIVDCQINC